MFDYLLFDLDGTLTDSKEGLFKSFRYALSHYGIEENDEANLKRFIGPPAHYAFCEFYNFSEDKAIEAVSIFRERFESIGIFENMLYDGVFDMLKALKEHGKKLALATAKPEHSAWVVLEHFNIAQFFDVVSAATRENRDHNKTKILQKAIAELNAPKDKVVMIGDRKFDILAAKELDIKTIGVQYGYAPPNELYECGCDYIVDSVSELLNILL